MRHGEVEHGIEEHRRPGPEPIVEASLARGFQRGLTEDLLAEVRLQESHEEPASFQKESGRGNESLPSKLLLVPVDSAIGEQRVREAG